MRTKVQRWGNSLAVRIPKAFAEDVGIEADSPIDLSLSDGDLVLSPPKPAALALKDLLAGITDENLHREIETGPAVGDEVW